MPKIDSLYSDSESLGNWDEYSRLDTAEPGTYQPPYLLPKCIAYWNRAPPSHANPHPEAFWRTSAHARPCFENITKVMKTISMEEHDSDSQPDLEPFPAISRTT